MRGRSGSASGGSASSLRLSLQAVETMSAQEFKASVLGAYERGERSISVPRLQRLALLYDVPVDLLLPAPERKPSDPPGGGGPKPGAAHRPRGAARFDHRARARAAPALRPHDPGPTAGQRRLDGLDPLGGHPGDRAAPGLRRSPHGRRTRPARAEARFGLQRRRGPTRPSSRSGPGFSSTNERRRRRRGGSPHSAAERVPSPNPLPSSSRPSLAGEFAVAVGEHEHPVADVLVAAPGAHHEGVVDRQAGDRVDPLRPDLVSPDDEPREVVVRTGRGERSGHREQHDLALAERLGRADRPAGRPLSSSSA